MIASRFRASVVVGLFSLLVGLGLFRPWVHGIDGAGYYAWLRSAVVDGDLDTADEFAHFDRLETEWSDPFRATSTGLHANPYPIGAALLWAPAFLLVHALAPVGGYPADGYSPPYIWAISLSSACFVLVGLLLLLDIARSWARPGAAFWGIAGVWLASPLVFYQYAHPSMSHAADMLVNSTVVWWWSRTRVAMPAARWWFVLGLLIGLAGMVRQQNLLLGLFPGLSLVLSFLRWRWAPAPVLACAAALAAGALLAFAPQLWVWGEVFGSPFVNVQALAYRAPLLIDPLRPHLIEVLFSSNRGLFIWSPILLPATVGSVALWCFDRRLAAFLIANAALQIYLIASWSVWWGGAAFGARLLLGVIPLWALGLAAGFEWLLRRGLPPLALPLASAAFTVWNALLMAQYAFGLVARNGPADLSALLRNQWTVIARIVEFAAR